MKALAPVLLILALAACGRQEPVGNVPSSEDLANAANVAAATAAANAGEEEMAVADRNYVNNQRGFSITLPESWVRDAAGSTADGIFAKDPGAGANIHVFWSGNAQGRSLQQVVDELTQGLEGVDGDFIGDNEYRCTANDGDGNSVAIRLFRKADGTLVTATFVYPEMLGEQYQPVAERTLDTLHTFDTAAPTEQPATAGNATDID